jgi:RNA polymerase sigma factor (sigma-70 family)
MNFRQWRDNEILAGLRPYNGNVEFPDSREFRMATLIPNATTRTRAVMAAVVLGTALTAAPELSASQATVPTAAVDDITRYCQACWRNARLPADRWQDCTQQVFIRLLERVSPEAWPNVLKDLESTERREFVRAIDAVKKRTQRTRSSVPFLADVADRHDRFSNEVKDQREAVNAVAVSVLSPRQRQIVELSFGGWAIPEIADELGTSPERISDEKYKAVQKLRTYFGTT